VPIFVVASFLSLFREKYKKIVKKKSLIPTGAFWKNQGKIQEKVNPGYLLVL
jgi:hypothetical protein